MTRPSGDLVVDEHDEYLAQRWDTRDMARLMSHPFELPDDELAAINIALRQLNQRDGHLKLSDPAWREPFTVPAETFDLIERAFGHLPTYEPIVDDEGNCILSPNGAIQFNYDKPTTTNKCFTSGNGEPRTNLLFKGRTMLRGE